MRIIEEQNFEDFSMLSHKQIVKYHNAIVGEHNREKCDKFCTKKWEEKQQHKNGNRENLLSINNGYEINNKYASSSTTAASTENFVSSLVTKPTNCQHREYSTSISIKQRRRLLRLKFCL